MSTFKPYVLFPDRKPIVLDPDLVPDRNLRPTPNTFSYTTSTSSTSPGIFTTTVTSAPLTSTTSTISTTTGKGTRRTTTETTTTTSDYYYPTPPASSTPSSTTTTIVSLATSLPTDGTSNIVTAPTNTSTQSAVVSRTTSTSTGEFGISSSSSTSFLGQSNTSSLSTTFTNSSTTGLNQNTISTPTIVTTSQSPVTTTGTTTIFGDTSTSTTTPSGLSQPTTSTTSTSLAYSSRQSFTSTFSFPASTSSSALMSLTDPGSGGIPLNSTLTNSVVMQTTTTSSPTSSPSSSTTIYAGNGSQYLLATTTSTSSTTGTSSTTSITPTTTITVVTTGSTLGSSSPEIAPTTSYLLTTSHTTSSSNWRTTFATATFTSSQLSPAPSIEITLAPPVTTDSSTSLVERFSTSPSSTFLASTTKSVSLLANVTNGTYFSNTTLNASNRSVGSSSIAVISADSNDNFGHPVVGVSAPTWLAYVGATASFLATVGAFWYGLWSRGGNLQNSINNHLMMANYGQLDEATASILRAQGRIIINRLGYAIVNRFDAPYLSDRIDSILETNRRATNPMAQLMTNQLSVLEEINEGIRTIQTIMNSQIPRQTGSFNSFIPEEGPLPSIRVAPIPQPSAIQPTIIGASSSGGRRLEALEITTIHTQDTRIVDLWSYLVKVQQSSFGSTEKYQALTLAQAKVLQILNEGNIDQNDISTLYNELIPNIQLESNAINLWVANLDKNSRLAGTQSLAVQPLNSSLYSWNINFMPNGAFRNDLALGKGRIFLMDPNRPVFDNSSSRTNLNSILLDSENSQYIGSDANEFITIGGGLNTTYNIAAMAGDDVIFVNPQMIGSSVVNIYGGLGNNTYVIYLQNSWDKLPSTVHIWDFDRTKDSLIFVSSDRLGGVTPYIRESKRTLFNSTLDDWSTYPNGEIRFEKTKAQASNALFVNLFHSFLMSSYSAAEHEFTGQGLPIIIIDEKNYNAFDPNSLFSSPNVFKSTQTVDIADNISGETAQLFIGTEPNTVFSQLDSNNDHDLFKVHLTAGKIYVFSMQHNPYEAGDAVLDTTLILKDANGNSLANSNVLSSSKSTGNSRIDYVALQDGDYFLDASGSAPTMTADHGKYSIGAVEIARTDCWPGDSSVGGFRGGDRVTNGSFNSATNHVGFKISLLAGDYVELNFAALGSPEITVLDSNGLSVNTSSNTSVSQSNQTFLAQKTGDYFIDARCNRVSDTPFELHTNLKDVEGDFSTKATLNVNNVVSSSINSLGDHDYFKVFLNANQNYQFDMKKQSDSNTLSPYLSLFDSNRNRVAYNDDIDSLDSCFDSSLIYRSNVSGEYFLDASCYAGRSTGNYCLSYKII